MRWVVVCRVESPAKDFDKRTDQGVRCCIRKEHPKEGHADMEISTQHDHGATEPYESPHDGRSHRDWRRGPRERVDPPRDGYQKSDTCPGCNSASQVTSCQARDSDGCHAQREDFSREGRAERPRRAQRSSVVFFADFALSSRASRSRAFVSFHGQASRPLTQEFYSGNKGRPAMFQDR